MPRYFFDCFDGETTHSDLYGMELTDVREAADQAACLLGAMMNERVEASIGSVGTRAASVMVRQRDGVLVYVSHGTFHGRFVSGGVKETAVTRMP